MDREVLSSIIEILTLKLGLWLQTNNSWLHTGAIAWKSGVVVCRPVAIKAVANTRARS